MATLVRRRPTNAALALVVALLVAACASDPEPDPVGPPQGPAPALTDEDAAPTPGAIVEPAPDEPAPDEPAPAPDGPPPEPTPDPPAAVDSATPAPVASPAVAAPPHAITAEGWTLDAEALGARPPAERAALIAARAQALEVLAGEVRAAAALARERAPDAADLHAAVDDLGRLVAATRAVLVTLAAQERTLADGLTRVGADEVAARARRDRAAAQRARPASEPVYPDLSLEQARAAIEADLRRLAEERARLAEGIAAALDAPAIAAEAPLVAREAERLAQALPLTLARTRSDEGALVDLARVAQGLAVTARAAVKASERARDGLHDLARRERELARLLEEAATFELDRRRARLDEVNRQVLDRVRRAEEVDRLARREQELDAQLARLQQALAQAEARAREEEAEVAAVRSRTQTLTASDDPALRSYQLTLDDHDRRLEAARKRRDAARADLETMQARLTTERDTRAALVLTRRDEIEAAHRAWEQDRDPRPLEELERTLAQAVSETEAVAVRVAERHAETTRQADEAQALAEQSAAEGERRALYLGSAPETHRPVLAAIEEVRGLIESTRREEARHRRALARAIDDARHIVEQDLAALRRELDDVVAARAATEEARKLNTGALRASASELRALFTGQHQAWSARLAAWDAASDAQRRRDGARLVIAGGVAVALLLVGWRVRRRARARVEQLLATRVDPERRVIVDPAARWSFYAAYVLRDAAPWAALVAVPAAAGAVLELPRETIIRATLAAGALFATRFLARLNHLLFRDRLIRAVVPLSEENKRPLNDRLRLALAAFGPLLAAFLLVHGIPELWATAVVLRATLSVLVVLTLISILHVARHDVGRMLRVEVAPPEASGGVQPIEWARALYNRVVDDLLTLVLLDLLAIGTLWVGGYVEQSAFLLRGTVQTALSVGAALVLVATVRKLNLRVTAGALSGDSSRPGARIALSMAAFIGTRLAEGLILAALALSLFDAWGGNIDPVITFLVSDRFVAGLVAAVKIVGICAVAYYANRLAMFTVDAFVEQTLRSATPEVARRRDTFAPLIKSFIHYALLLAAFIYSATSAGVDVVSILAGLGVLGLAVAFGAQTLVKDVISGVFVIMEDELAVGDWVRIGDVEGTVEHVGVRVTRVRTLNGVLISIPNGAITEVQNFNRGWNRAVVEIDITYDANVEKAMAVLLEVAEEYRRQRPDLVVEPCEVQGIVRYGVSGLTLRVRAKTAPLALWQVERELRLRSLVAFEDQGIEIPLSRHVVMIKTEDGEGRLRSVDLSGLLRQAAPAALPPPPEPAMAARETTVLPRPVSLEALEGTPAAASTPPEPEPGSEPADDGEARPAARTRRLVLSEEARARLADEAYVRAVTAEEPEIPPEMQASIEAIEKHRQDAEAARQATATPSDADPASDAPAADPPHQPGVDPGVAPASDPAVDPVLTTGDEPAPPDAGPARDHASAPAPDADEPSPTTRGAPPPTPTA